MRMKLLLLAACAWGVAQAAFQEVEWVEATGAQWINTRYVPACTDRFEMKVAVRATDATCALWCSRGATTTTNTLTCFAMNPARLRFDRFTNTSQYTTDNLLVKDRVHVVTADYGARKTFLDGVEQVTMAAGDFEPESPLVLLASHLRSRALDNFAKARLFSFKVWNAEGTLVRDFVPVRDAATEACGLFEKVTGVFFPGLGREALVAGDVVADGAAYEETFDGYAVVDVPADETRTLTADDVAAFGARPLVKTGLGTLVAGVEWRTSRATSSSARASTRQRTRARSARRRASRTWTAARFGARCGRPSTGRRREAFPPTATNGSACGARASTARVPSTRATGTASTSPGAAASSSRVRCGSGGHGRWSSATASWTSTTVP